MRKSRGDNCASCGATCFHSCLCIFKHHALLRRKTQQGRTGKVWGRIGFSARNAIGGDEARGYRNSPLSQPHAGEALGGAGYDRPSIERQRGEQVKDAR